MTPGRGLELLREAFVDPGRVLEIVGLNEADGGGYTASSYRVGSVAQTLG